MRVFSSDLKITVELSAGEARALEALAAGEDWQTAYAALPYGDDNALRAISDVLEEALVKAGLRVIRS